MLRRPPDARDEYPVREIPPPPSIVGETGSMPENGFCRTGSFVARFDALSAVCRLAFRRQPPPTARIP
ncbi:hypothetical protein GCM10012289_74210 [Nonomuraea cavernae]|uniref:Uncharacterized protein n=1 Tax=Nonomuraea cavernae TaxID=2045107 RepID=A0A918DU63_9ACTN|nr:hypothetical protein GCM10012289_74210 [Nonomuraea cavernae]